MTSKPGGSGEASFHLLQPERDPRLNWEVDLAEKLESYLLQICSGEFQSGEDANHISVNFAEGEGSFTVWAVLNYVKLNVSDWRCVFGFFSTDGIAALLIQGSIQVYSRKVEYLYSLVVRALEFLSEKRFDCYSNFVFLISARHV